MIMVFKSAWKWENSPEKPHWMSGRTRKISCFGIYPVLVEYLNKIILVRSER
jgi:hypothetical protein